jgi:hypothetical protein
MFFLLRVAFWLSLVVMLLPTKETQPNAAAGPAISATDALGAAAAAVADMRQFCTRQPDACTVGAQAAHAFGEKAQAGARMVYELIADTAKDGEADKPAAQGAGGDTLTATDRAPSWRGPPPAPAKLARGGPA